MTPPNEVRDLFLTALEQTVNAGGQCITGAFKLLFLFPAIACVFLAEVLVRLEALAFRVPKALQLPIPFPGKEKAL